MAYATVQELADYLQKPLSEMPSTSQRMLDDASELIDHATRTVLSEIENPEAYILDAAKRATIRQVEYWMLVGTEIDITGEEQNEYSNISIGSFSVAYDRQHNKEKAILAPRARRVLLMSGLLYKGVRMV